ncbi:methyl-accepting chemotaxis protein [Cellulosilyticum ruminicola]|uniref:methyl-accepting chemotaxis protein n=1 Tax=Cellulosilyticum ruminicola TaxID=425254 RepID=UPI0006D2843D|nr:methyl-accepting chemotaxis protein [Cellulosilyticum ruminicola]
MIDNLIKEINQKIDKVQLVNKAVVSNIDSTLEITDQFAKAVTDVTKATQSSTGAINELFTTIEEQNKSVLEIASVVGEISEEAKEVQEQAQITTEITNKVSEAMVDNIEEIEKLMKDTTQLKTEIEFFKTNN